MQYHEILRGRRRALRRAKKPRRVMQARVSSLVNLDGWFGMFF
jgi:hypothetical protein